MLKGLTVDEGDELSNILPLAGSPVIEDSVFTALWVRERPRGHTEFRIQLSNHPLVQTWACHPTSYGLDFPPRVQAAWYKERV